MKFKNKLFKYLLFPNLILTPFISLSMNDSSIVDNVNQVPDNSTTLEEEQKKRLEQLIEYLLNYIDSKLEIIDNNNKLNEEQKLSEKFYLLQLRVYLNNNKIGIVNNPENYGLMLVLPKIIANNQKLSKGSVVYNDLEYKNIVWGNNGETTYSDVAQKVDEIIFEKNNFQKVDNKTSQEFTLFLNKYFDNLKKEIKNIFFNNKDAPIYNKDFILDVRETEGKVYFSASSPLGWEEKNIYDWSDWIRKKITKRSLIFDLKENQKLDNPQKEVLPNVPDTDQREPKYIESPDGDILNVDNLNLNKLPEFEPWLQPNFLNENNDSIINMFKKDSSNQNIFFFKNPFSRIIKLEILDVEKEIINNEETLKLTIKMQKILNNNSNQDEKIYQKILKNLSSIKKENQKRYVEINYEFNQKITQEFDFIFDQLGLIKTGKNPYFSDILENTNIKKVEAITQTMMNMFFKEENINFQNKKILNIFNKSDSNSMTNILKEEFEEFKNHFFNYLKHSKIRPGLRIENVDFASNQYKEFLFEYFTGLISIRKRVLQKNLEVLNNQYENNQFILDDNDKKIIAKSINTMNKIMKELKEKVIVVQNINNKNCISNFLELTNTINSKLNLLNKIVKLQKDNKIFDEKYLKDLKKWLENKEEINELIWKDFQLKFNNPLIQNLNDLKIIKNFLGENSEFNFVKFNQKYFKFLINDLENQEIKNQNLIPILISSIILLLLFLSTFLILITKRIIKKQRK